MRTSITFHGDLCQQILDMGGIILWNFSGRERMITFFGHDFNRRYFGRQTGKRMTLEWDDFFSEYVHPENRQDLQRELRKSLMKNTDCILRFRLRNYETGTWQWLEMFGRVARQCDGSTDLCGGLKELYVS